MQPKFFQFIVITFICLSYQIASAQNNSIGHPNQIFISPLRIIDLANPGIEIGYQRAYGKNLATAVSIARMIDLVIAHLPDDPRNISNYKGWRLQAEQKYFLPTFNTNRPYLAVDAMYLKVNYDSNSTFATDTAKNAPTYSDNFHIDKSNFSVNAKIGIQIPVKHFIFDFVAGIGLKHRLAIRSGLENPNAYENTPVDVNIWTETNKAGNEFTLSLPINIRVAYEF
ncbi:hypothetical protein [Mucilaginibacter sp. UYCu711]|uniref:hypothetical protein n=1 Tax=Mucilaginibacter sp. UYCu711 TaxID=3156339 RepID=UPI003D22AB33